MKRLFLLCALVFSACAQLPTETAAHVPPNARGEGGMMMGGGSYVPCTDASGQTIPCP